MADTKTQQGQIDSVVAVLEGYWANDTTTQGAISRTLDSIALVQCTSIETQIATSTTITYTPATVFGSAGNFKFVGVFVLDSSASTAMQVEINNSGNLISVSDALAYGGDASTSQIEIKNNSGASTLDVLVVLGR